MMLYARFHLHGEISLLQSISIVDKSVYTFNHYSINLKEEIDCMSNSDLRRAD